MKDKKKTIIISAAVVLALLFVVILVCLLSGKAGNIGVHAEDRLMFMVQGLYQASVEREPPKDMFSNVCYYNDVDETSPSYGEGMRKLLRYYITEEDWQLSITSKRYENHEMAVNQLNETSLRKSGETNYTKWADYEDGDLKETAYHAYVGATDKEMYSAAICYVDGESLVYIYYAEFPDISDEGKSRLEKMCNTLNLPVPPKPVKHES